MSSTRDLIVALRGGVPDVCDFCGEATDPDDLHPEEGGEWACTECIRAWDAPPQKGLDHDR